LIYCTSILAFVISIVLFVYHYTTLESLLPYTNSYSQVFLLIGILLLIGGTLLLFILNGYILKMIRASLEKSSELPEWNNYSELFKSGFVFTIGISIIAFFGSLLQNVLTSSATGQYGLILVVISVIIQLLVSLYLPLSAINYADEKNFGSFFDVPKILKMFSLEYVGVFLVVSIITSVIVLIPAMIAIMPLMAIFAPMDIMGETMLFLAVPALIIISILAWVIVSVIGFYMSIYSYRAYSNYFISKKQI